jgi:hypothetical protein
LRRDVAIGEAKEILEEVRCYLTVLNVHGIPIPPGLESFRTLTIATPLTCNRKDSAAPGDPLRPPP